DSLLGVPGLLEAARRGRVAVVNPIGSAIIEHPALTGLLGRVAPIMLGEELAPRGPETWWCGHPRGLSHVLASLEELVVFPVGASTGLWPVVGSNLSADALAGLRDRIRSRPADWVGQEVVEPSTVPTVSDNGTLEPRPAVIRTFSVAGDAAGDGASHGFTVLPGGLTRVGVATDAGIISSRGEGTSKDTWVASAEPALQQSTWLPCARAQAARGHPRAAHPPARPRRRPTVHAGPQRGACRVGHPVDTHGPDPPRPAARNGGGRWRRVPAGPALGPPHRLGLRCGFRAR